MRPALALTILAMLPLLFGSRRQDFALALATPESKRYLFLFFMMVLGIPFAYHRGLAFQGVLGYTANILFFFLLVSQVTTLQRMKSLVWVICLSTAFYSIVGGLLQGASITEGRLEVLGDVFDPNDTAYLLLSLFPLSMYFVRFDEGFLKRLVAVAAVLGSIVTILLTGSRGGILAFGAMLLIMVFTRLSGMRMGHKVLVATLMASTWFLIQDKVNVDRYLTLSDISSDYNATAKGGRIDLWNSAIDLSLENPVTGVGVDCFSFANWRSRVLAGDSYRRYHAVHNSFLQIAAEVGLIGFFVFLLLHWRTARTFLRIAGASRAAPATEDIQMRALAGLMFLGFVGLVVSGFFISQGYSVFCTLYFGLGAAMARIRGAARPDAASTAATLPAGTP